MTDIRSLDIQYLPVDELRLDAENPRLPERVRGRPQSEILRFFYENGVLEEIAQSYMDHGFFRHEPLIVTRENGQSYTVIEGNRRLATLKILRGAPEADDRNLLVEPFPGRLEQLAEVPCFVVSSRDEIRAYVGFRHIGGIKTWEPEAKARYVLGEVARLVEHNSPDPFRALGRRIGSNTQGVRNRTWQSASCCTRARSSASTLRQTNDLSLARKVVEDLDTATRAWRLVDEVKLLMDAIPGAEITDSLLLATEQLHQAARSRTRLRRAASEAIGSPV